MYIYSFFAVFHPVCVHDVRYVRKLSILSVFYCLGVQLYHLCGKRRFVCAHIGQKRHIYPPSINRLLIDSIPPPPIPQVHRGGCYREKFFLFLFFSDFARIHRMFGLRIFFLFLLFDFYSYFIFLFFLFSFGFRFDSVFQIILFNYFDSIKVRHLILDSVFRNIHRFDSIQVLLDIYSFAILVFASEFLLASILTCFSIVYSML